MHYSPDYCEAPTSNVLENISNKIEFIDSTRGGQLLILNGRKYHRRNIYKNLESLWICANTSACKGNITLSVDRKNIVDKKQESFDELYAKFSKTSCVERGSKF